MATGRIKFYSERLQYGFIRPDDPGPDVYVHISAVERAGILSLREGQHISFDLAVNRSGKAKAVNLVVSE